MTDVLELEDPGPKLTQKRLPEPGEREEPCGVLSDQELHTAAGLPRVRGQLNWTGHTLLGQFLAPICPGLESSFPLTTD